MEQLIFLAIAILYGIGVGIYRAVKWANRQLTGAAIAPSSPRAAAQNETIAQASALPQESSPASSQATAEDFRRWEQELQAESERASLYFRQRAEELRAERNKALGKVAPPAPPKKTAPIATTPSNSVIPQDDAPPLRLFQTKDDLIRAFILREALGPPLSRRRRSSRKPP